MSQGKIYSKDKGTCDLILLVKGKAREEERDREKRRLCNVVCCRQAAGAPPCLDRRAGGAPWQGGRWRPLSGQGGRWHPLSGQTGRWHPISGQTGRWQCLQEASRWLLCCCLNVRQVLCCKIGLGCTRGSRGAGSAKQNGQRAGGSPLAVLKGQPLHLQE